MLVAAFCLLPAAYLVPLLATGGTLRAARPEAPAHRRVLAVAYDKTGCIVSMGSEGWLRRWSGGDGRTEGEWRLVPPDVGVVTAQFSGDGTRVALARLDGNFDVWDLGPPTLRRRFQLPDVDNFGFGILSFSRDGSTLAVSPAMGQLAVWDVGTGGRRLSLPADATRWGRMALSPDGERLARSGRLPVEVWNVATGQQLRRMDTTTVDPLELVWAPDGQRLALAPNLYDQLPDDLFLPSVISRRDRASLKLAPGYGANAITFSPDGRFLAGALVAPVRDPARALPQPRAVPDVWDWRVGRARFERRWPLGEPGHVRAITSIAWSPDGRRLATGGQDGAVLFWDAETGARLGRAQPAPLTLRRKADESYFMDETPGEEN